MIRESIKCPECGHEPALNRCWECGWTADSATTDAPLEARDRTDTRSEEERKHDARQAVEAMGWVVVDLEQGWRPFTCKHCGGDIAGGTHVPKGTPDWLVMGHGLMAWVEFKSGTGTLSKYQKAFRDACAAAGVPWTMARTTEHVVAFLQALRLSNMGGTE